MGRLSEAMNGVAREHGIQPGRRADSRTSRASLSRMSRTSALTTGSGVDEDNLRPPEAVAPNVLGTTAWGEVEPAGKPPPRQVAPERSRYRSTFHEFVWSAVQQLLCPAGLSPSSTRGV